MRDNLRGGLALEGQRRRSDFHVNSRAVQTNYFSLTERSWFVLMQHLGQALVNGLPAGRMKDFPHWLTDEFFGPVGTEQFHAG